MGDWFTVRTWAEEFSQMISDNSIGKTSFSDYSDTFVTVMTEGIMAVTVFGIIMATILILLWIERKFFARIMDRRGATMAIRSLWVGEGGEHVDWYDELPFGTGKPLRWLNELLNNTFGSSSEHETVDRVNDRSYHGIWFLLPGLIQNVADGMKFMTKEWMVPAKADKFIFEVAPFIIITSTVMLFAFIPLSSEIYSANPELSLLFLMAIFGIAPLGVFFAGWSSNNKYTLLGGIRSAAQLTAYEIPLLVTVLSVAVISGSLNIIEIVEFQVSSGSWNIFLLPFGAGLFLITMVAEVERIPFDMPEAEAELVEGWWTEYGGMRWGLMFASEYLRCYAACLLFSLFFLGGWEMPFGDSIINIIPNQDLILGAVGVGLIGLALGMRSEYPALLAPLPLVFMSVVPSIAWLLFKSWVMFAVFVWIRASFHRIRTDQILEFGWRWLLPLSLVNLGFAFWLRLAAWDGGEWPLFVPGLITGIAFVVFVILGIDEDTSELEGRTRPYSVYTGDVGPASPRSHEK